MKIRHILKDGTELDNIDGHIVRMNDAKSVYKLIKRINERKD